MLLQEYLSDNLTKEELYNILVPGTFLDSHMSRRQLYGIFR